MLRNIISLIWFFFLIFFTRINKKSLEWTNERGLSLPTQMSTQGSLNVIQKEDIVNSQKFNYVLDKLSAAVIELVTDKEDFQWMKKQKLLNQFMFMENLS